MLLHLRFVQIAKSQPGKLAFIDRGTDKRVTYGKALIASLILARRFRGYGSGFLGIMVPTSAGCALSILATLMSGLTPVMINYSTGAANNIRYARKKCGFRTVVTSRALIEKIQCPPDDDMVFLEDIFENISWREKLWAAFLSRFPVPIILQRIHHGREDDNAVILFTSGSEKDPKAVELTHRNIASNIQNFSTVMKLSDRDRMFAVLPYFHIFGLTVNLWTPLYHGMTIITCPNPVDYDAVCRAAREEGPTVLAATPTFLWGYLRKSEAGDFASLRVLVSGADKCPEALRQGFLEKHGITVYEGYGTTETSPVISVNTPEANRPGSVGKAIPGVQVRIENFETGEACDFGQIGRIMVQGDLVMKGYLDDFEQTSMRIRHGWYDTGDMGYLDEEAYLWHEGRLRRFVKVGGEMVSLVKVEDVLEQLLPEGVSCCVVELPDALKGSRIAAVVTQRLNEREIIAKMSEALPNISIPKQFIIMEELPRMGSGKIDFRSVTDMVHDLLLSRG